MTFYLALLVLVLVGTGVAGVAIAAVLGSRAELQFRDEVKGEIRELRNELLEAEKRVARLEEDREFYEKLLERPEDPEAG